VQRQSVETVRTDALRLQRLGPTSRHVETLAGWEYAQWGDHEPGRRLDEAVGEFRGQCGEGGVPSVFVVLAGDTPVGMASLIADDMRDRPDLTPWLASVYVQPLWRGRGIASWLVRRVEEEARTHGVERLYLFTADRQPLYRRLSWQALEETDYRGERVTIMLRRLPTAADLAEPS